MAFPDDALFVKSGDIPLGIYGIADTLISNDELIIYLKDLQQCTIVTDRHESYQTGVGRIAGGILGAALLGPIGAAGGLLAGGKRRIDQTIILCRLFDGRSFTAECSQLTAAKLSQIATSNQSAIRSSIPASGVDSAGNVDFTGVQESDVIDCPMCAERIKAKAKICRFCGCNVQEEKSKELSLLAQQPDVDEIHLFDDLYQRYLTNTEQTRVFDRDSALEVMTLFSLFQKKNPTLSYRDLADMVKNELDGNTKQPLYDLIKNGFNFLRVNKRFDVIDNRYVIVRKT